jgi:hypothetical protein
MGRADATALPGLTFIWSLVFVFNLQEIAEAADILFGFALVPNELIPPRFHAFHRRNSIFTFVCQLAHRRHGRIFPRLFCPRLLRTFLDLRSEHHSFLYYRGIALFLGRLHPSRPGFASHSRQSSPRRYPSYSFLSWQGGWTFLYTPVIIIVRMDEAARFLAVWKTGVLVSSCHVFLMWMEAALV